MTRTLLVLGITLAAALPAKADITHKLTQSAQISVDQAYSSATRLGSTYSVTGSGVTPSVTLSGTTTSGAIGGLDLSSITDGVPALTDTDFTQSTTGESFSVTESYVEADTIPSATSVSTGNVTSLPAFGTVVTGSGGVAGDLAATANAAGDITITAGGAGTSGILSNSQSIEID